MRVPLSRNVALGKPKRNSVCKVQGMRARFVLPNVAMTEPELQTVLKAMRHEGINIVAIHQHMSSSASRRFGPRECPYEACFRHVIAMDGLPMR